MLQNANLARMHAPQGQRESSSALDEQFRGSDSDANCRVNLGRYYVAAFSAVTKVNSDCASIVWWSVVLI